MTKRDTETIRREIEAERAALLRSVAAVKAGAGRVEVARAVMTGLTRATSAGESAGNRKDDEAMTRETNDATTGRRDRIGRTAARAEALKTAAQTGTARLHASAEDMAGRIEEGLDGLPDTARARVRAAREAAISAQREVEESARQGVKATREAARAHPLLAGAAVFALGAAVAACLPRTRAEDRALGAYRDHMLDEADRALREEISTLKAAARAALFEGMSVASDAVTGATPARVDAASAAARMTSAALAEARRRRPGHMS